MTKKRFCIVPFRDGSTRLPKKNIRPLAGKPLSSWTVEAVAPHFDTVILSSNSQEFLDVVYEGANLKNKNNLVKDLRPESLSGNKSKVVDTVEHYVRSHFGDEHNEVWLALPTCPLRSSEDVKNAQIQFDANKEADGILSITDYEFAPTLGMDVDENGYMTDWHPSRPWATGNTRGQDHPDVYRPNGAIYGMSVKHWKKVGNYYTGKIATYKMPRSRSVDIDFIEEFLVAETFLKNQEYIQQFYKDLKI